MPVPPPSPAGLWVPPRRCIPVPAAPCWAARALTLPQGSPCPSRGVRFLSGGIGRKLWPGLSPGYGGDGCSRGCAGSVPSLGAAAVPEGRCRGWAPHAGVPHPAGSPVGKARDAVSSGTAHALRSPSASQSRCVRWWLCHPGDRWHRLRQPGWQGRQGGAGSGGCGFPPPGARWASPRWRAEPLGHPSGWTGHRARCSRCRLSVYAEDGAATSALAVGGGRAQKGDEGIYSLFYFFFP